MSETNPYIVKEHKGDFENTIQYFVTGRPLTTDEEMRPDSHGVHPVSPLGFMIKEDGTTLAPAEPLSGFSAYGDSGCTAQEAYDDSYKVSGKYYMYGSDVISFPVLDIHRSEDGTKILVTVNGLLPQPENSQSFYFRNITSDDYTPTGLVGTTFSNLDSLTQDVGSGTTAIALTTDIVFDGTVGEGKLAFCVNHEVSGHKFLTVEDPDSDTLSGIYVWGESEGEPIRKIFNWGSCEVGETEDTGGPCYEGNGYSDTEVAKWVNEKVGAMTHYGCHPSSEPGDLRDAGGLVNWFVTNGDVDITGGAGNTSVMIPGFGLGQGFQGKYAVDTGTNVRTEDPDETSEHKWLTFGYGTKHDAYAADVGKTALPLDWPFSHSSDYADEKRDNNITLIKDGVQFYDGTDTSVVGGLTRISRECHVCDGTGVVIEGPCHNCGGTGEEPDCETCGGSGKVIDSVTQEEHECPDCHGMGFLGGHRYVMDKVHVCLYNDFKPSDGAHDHTAGTTVLKKTFVNLATPITQKDGDTFEVTVSLPNVNIPDAYSGNDAMQNLSGYYAYVSQPRVYVVSGTWEFSDTRVFFDTKDLLTYDLGDTMFKARKGFQLDNNTEVKVKISFDAYSRKKFAGIGIIADGRYVVLKEALNIPAGLLRKIKRSADSDGNIKGSICGAAYVEANNDTLTQAIQTDIGLNAVRNEEGALGNDMGNKVSGSLQQYNKLYTADTEDTENGTRKHVLFEADGTPRKDQRQIVATVYPTTTNTFPWALTHRRKLGFLDKLMTMESDSGVNGMFARVYRMNRAILESIPMSESLAPEDYPLDMYSTASWNSQENDRLSIIGALLTVVMDPDVDVSRKSQAQPVRRALAAVKMLAEDYRNARVSRLGDVGAGVTSYVSDAEIRKDGSALSDYSSLGSTVNLTPRNDYEGMAHAIRLRHLPEFLAAAGTDEYTGEPLSPIMNAYPYRDNSKYSYYSGNPYGYGTFDTTTRTEEVPCEVASSTGTEAWPMSNSIVKACIGKVDDTVTVEELYRSAELHAIDFSDIGDILQPQAHRSGTDISWLDAIDAFTKIVSPDNIPVPSTGGIDYTLLFDQKEDQLPFIMADAYGYYRVLTAIDWNGADYFIATTMPTDATTMPTDDSLALFLKDYVPGYAARLAVRNWDSYRVKVTSPATPSPDTTYLTRMHWYDPECDAASRGIYASDAFIVGNEFSDMNMNRIEFSSADKARSLNCSVPPYSVKDDYNILAPFATENDPYSVSYIRVFMKFAFSEDAGRWYCMDYRQAPVSYLSPLYGAKALDQTVDGKRLWSRPECVSAKWQAPLMHTYEEYCPLDINPSLVRSVMRKDANGECPLMFPYLPVDDGGLGLNAPVNKAGTSTAESIASMPHANFWSVREFLRPATGAANVGDIPRYYKDHGEWTWGETGGIMSDAVLWGQYDYPHKGNPEYHIPDTDIPDADLSKRSMVYARRNGTTQLMDTGDIQVGPHENTVLAVSYGAGRE